MYSHLPVDQRRDARNADRRRWAGLVALGLLESQPGSAGGCTVTEAGREVAARLEKVLAAAGDGGGRRHSPYRPSRSRG